MSHVVILGLGQYPKGSGVSATEFFARQGHQVTVMDFYYSHAMAANAKRIKMFKNVHGIFNKHDLKALRTADLVVKHQRIRMNEPEVVEALRLGIPLESELSLFLKHCPARVIGVTGTRGKSTTTALLAEILTAGKKQRVWLGGNILVSPLTFLSKIRASDLVVLEMSSFQLEGTGLADISPPLAVWTNLMTDHLNAYAGMEEYAEAKAQIFRHQKPEDIVFLSADRAFDLYAKEAPGHVVRVGRRGQPETNIVAKTPLAILGEHNAKNAEFAVAVARYLDTPVSIITRVLKKFKGLPGRIEAVAKIRGVQYVNDTTATTPDGMIAALRTLAPKAKHVYLIVGGADKELEFEGAAREIKKKKAHVVLLTGTAYEKFSRALKKQGVMFETASSMKAAVALQRKKATRGDIILLSPACASFGLFKNEYDRGEVFVREVRRKHS